MAPSAEMAVTNRSAATGQQPTGPARLFACFLHTPYVASAKSARASWSIGSMIQLDNSWRAGGRTGEDAPPVVLVGGSVGGGGG